VESRSEDFIRFHKYNWLIAAVMSILYLIWAYQVIGWRSDHLIVVITALGLYFTHRKTRAMFWGFSIMLFYWLIYDSLRAFPNHMFNPVHIQEPYNIDKALFGITAADGTVQTLNEYWRANTNTFLDIFTALLYINWVPVPIALGIYFFFQKKRYMLELFYLFLWVNILGWIVYYLYPAAPPWYYEMYGVTENFTMEGNAGGLLSFDKYFGVNLFEDLYKKGSNVFAAIPSMHCAFPLLLIHLSFKAKLHWSMKTFFILFAIGIVFSSVYTNHHYLIDGLIGMAVAVISIVTFEYILLPLGLSKWLDKVERLMKT